MVAAFRRAAFLDRDGVLNRSLVRDGKPFAPRSLADFRILSGAREAVLRLKRRGLVVVVVTNQPDIGNGLVARSTVDRMHRKLARVLAIDDVLVCPHSQTDNCLCRKPKPGLLREAARKWRIDLRNSFLVGDRASDVVAGQAVGCYTLFLDRRYREPPPRSPDRRVRTLHAAVNDILSLVGARRASR